MISENKTLTVSDRGIKFASNKKNISNAILVLDEITMKDRGNFYCIGKNTVVYEPVVSGACYVRIKGKNPHICNLLSYVLGFHVWLCFWLIDKMAALWPFLGICAEVIILCLIIFIYEKKRNKAEFEESDTDQGPET